MSIKCENSVSGFPKCEVVADQEETISHLETMVYQGEQREFALRTRLEAVEKAAREVVAHQFDVESGYTNQSWVPSHKLKALAEVLNNGGQEGE